MTLFKQIMIVITILLSLVLVTVFGIHFKASRSFVENDLYQRAKNSVNALSLSLGDVSDDTALMETTINAMFDGGHFQRISLRDTENKMVYEKEDDLIIEGVPPLFIRLLNLRAPAADAVVSSGWNIVGSLEVQSYTGEACIRMWQIFKNLSFSFLILWGGCLGVSSLMVKFLLKSLNRIREQAKALEENRFIINPHIPAAPELKTVVVQMNKMVETIKNNYHRSLDSIKTARLLQFRDKVSGLYNKAYFIRQLKANLESREAVSKGEVALIAIEGMDALKENEGYAMSEGFIKETADLLKDKAEAIEGGLVTRLNAGEFALLFPCVSPKAAGELLGAVQEDIGNMIESRRLGEYLRVSSGLAAYTYEDSSSDIFSKLDYAATLAKNRRETAPVHFQEQNGPRMGRQEWKTLIGNRLDGQGFIFFCQPVLGGDGVYHKEVFIAMEDDEDNLRRAGFFMPTAMELGLARDIDRHVITRMAGVLEGTKDNDMRLGVNISADFIRNRKSFIWAREFLSSHKHLASVLVFEMSEAALIRYPDVCLDYAGLLRGMGFGLGIDNFTINDDALAMLARLTPAYIKSDCSYLYDDRHPEQSRITLGMLQGVAESLNIKLIGTKIETSNQLEDLQAAGIRYFQGEQVGEIKALEYYDG